VKTKKQIIIRHTKTEYVLEEEKVPLCILFKTIFQVVAHRKPSGKIITGIQVPCWNLQVCWSDHICRNKTESAQIRT